MNDFLSEANTVVAVTRLTHSRLQAFISAEVIVPVHSPDGPLFGPADLARLELLCDLAEHFDLADDGLGVVMSLIDQLHAARQQLHAVARALEAEPVEVRHRIGVRIMREQADF